VTERPPDVEIDAAVKAKELRFERKPDIDVIPYSNAKASVERTSQRDNLPPEVEEGVTYRDVSVRWRIGVRLEDEDD
jgi:hypothetical protein